MNQQLKDRFWKTVDTLDDRLERARRQVKEYSSEAIRRIQELREHEPELRSRWMRLVSRYQENALLKTWPAILLFLAIAIAGIAADDEFGNWTNWLPLPMCLVVMIPALFTLRVLRHGGRIFLASLFACFIVAVRMWVAFKGPIPYVAFPEIMYWTFALMMAPALWATSLRQPISAYLIWIAGLAVLFLARLAIPNGSILFRSDLLPVILSLFWALAVFGSAMSLIYQSEQRHGQQLLAQARKKSFPKPGREILRMHVVSMILGLVLAWFCLQYARSAPSGGNAPSPQSLEQGRAAVDLLWSQSVMFGWGQTCLLRLAKVVAQPMNVVFPDWMGWTGTMAAYGLFGFIGGIGMSIALVWAAIRRARRGIGATSAPQLALLAAQAILILTLFGGPKSLLPLLLLTGWISLGLMDNPKPRHLEDANSRLRISKFGLSVETALVGAALLMLLIATFFFLGPVWAKSSISSLRQEDYKKESIGRRIHLAKILAPWDPQVDVAEGLRLRETLARTPLKNWSELLFERTVNAYRRARKLDRYDPLITLQLAKLYQTAQRPEDARKTILEALAETPGAEELVEWLYRYSAQQKNNAVALAMVERGLRLHPDSPKWWKNLYAMQYIAGRGPEAGLALNTALTANPEDPNLQKATFERRIMAMQAADVGE